MAIGAVLAGIGLGLQVFGMLRQAKSAKEAASYNSAALNEAIMWEVYRSEAIADKIRASKRRMKGVQAAAYMKAGVKFEGTPLEVMADTASQFEEELAMNELDTKLTVSRLRMGIGAERIAAREARAAALISVGATILQTGAKYYGTRAPSTTPYGYWGGPAVQPGSGYTPSY